MNIGYPGSVHDARIYNEDYHGNGNVHARTTTGESTDEDSDDDEDRDGQLKRRAIYEILNEQM